MKSIKSLKTLQSNKKLLKDEWMYCMRMIQERIDEIEEINLENYKETLDQQYKVMGAVRHLVGKGYYYMTDERFKKISRNEKIENAISDMHKAIDEIEYR